MRIAIFTEVNETQLSFIRRFLLDEFGTNYNMVVEGDNNPTNLVQTPLTGEMLEVVAAKTGKTVLEVATIASSWGVTTLQQVLEHDSVPAEVKDVLYEYL